VSVEFLEPIAPGLDRKSFMAELKARIEDRRAVLDAPYVQQTDEA
jgi:hypothetical protein